MNFDIFFVFPLASGPESTAIFFHIIKLSGKDKIKGLLLIHLRMSGSFVNPITQMLKFLANIRGARKILERLKKEGKRSGFRRERG
jgi:hypothetical protein